jgi:hypothetical protein
MPLSAFWDIGDIDIRFTSKPGKGERELQEWCLLRQNQSPKQENHTHASSSNLLHLIGKGEREWCLIPHFESKKEGNSHPLFCNLYYINIFAKVGVEKSRSNPHLKAKKEGKFPILPI